IFLFTICIIHVISQEYLSAMNFEEHDTISKSYIAGQVLNIFNEPVDNVLIISSLPGFKDSLYCDFNGFFRIYLPDEKYLPGQKINIMFINKDYRLYDTTFVYSDLYKNALLKVTLTPKYKILVKGRIMAGNMAIENVDVTITHDNNSYKLKTLGCYYDDEDYWNCLYQGMFKHEVVTENPDDTVFLHFSKPGFKSQKHKFRFADYSGELIKYKMKYADSIPEMPFNNFSLKLAYPLNKESGWFLDLSYYRLFKIGNFNRLAAGIDISVLTLRETVEQNTFSGLESSFDTTYINGMAGPSVLIYLTKPNLRRFNTYAGSTFAFTFSSAEFVYQPFAGVRFFIDMNKSVSVEIKYLAYHFNAKRYRFNYLGNAESYTINKSDERLIVNLGLQICF
ncbi:MAG: hypothetical protein JSV22_05175, partial [Bacteroidales bacterium]